MEVETSGVTGIELLAVLFIGLKIGGIIKWSWVWVLSPIWIPIAVFLVVLAGVAIKIVLKK